MNNLIIYPLIILIVIGAFTQLYTSNKIDFTASGTDDYILIGNQTLNGTETELELNEGSLSLDFTMTVGIISIMIGAIALGLIGLNVIGSGLPDRSVKIIWNGIVFYGLWSIFSVLGYNSISSIPYLGAFLWFFLTLIYTLGVFGKMGD